MKKLLAVLAFLFCASAAFAQWIELPEAWIDISAGDPLTVGSVYQVGLSGPAEFVVNCGTNPVVTTGNLCFAWAAGSAPTTAHSSLIAVGNVWTAKLITNCTGAGKALTYDTSTDAYGCNTIASGSVATDAIWVAAGDLVYGTGASAASRLAAGTATQVLHSGATPAWGSVVNGDIAASTIDLTTKVTGLLPLANLANGSALSVLGRSANSSGVMASITATANTDCSFKESSSAVGCSNPYTDTQLVVLNTDWFGVGGEGYNTFFSGGATAYVNDQTGDLPGVTSFSTGAGTTGYASAQAGNSASAENAGRILVGGGTMIWSERIMITTLSDGTDTYIAVAGLCDRTSAGTAAAPCTDGVGFEYAQSADTHWRVFTCSNSTCTITATANTVTAGQWDSLALNCNAAGSSCSFTIAAAAVTGSPISTNIPTGAGRGTNINTYILKSAGTTPRLFSLDYTKFFMRVTTTR